MDYLKIYNTLDSTNKEAQRLLAAGQVDSGMTLIARQQTAGRGQYGRNWLAAPNEHLAMSLIYKPAHMTTTRLPMIGMKVSLGIVRALQSIHSDLVLKIKWPNDIYLNHRKVCGILIENALSGSTVQHCIIGIGLNVNESRFPIELPNATSLAMVTDQQYQPEDLAQIIRTSVLHLLSDKSTKWNKEYQKQLFGLGKSHKFILQEKEIYGQVLGVTDSGKLILDRKEGLQEKFASHELKWVISESENPGI